MKVDYYIVTKGMFGTEVLNGNAAKNAVHATVLTRVDQIIEREDVQFVDVHLANGDQFTASKMRPVKT